VDKELGGGLVPAVLKGVDDYPVVAVIVDPVEHVGRGGILGEGILSPLGETDSAGGTVNRGGLDGGETDGGRGSRGVVGRDRFSGNPVPGVGVGSSGCSAQRHCARGR